MADRKFCGECVTYRHALVIIPSLLTLIFGVMWVVLQTHAASPHPDAATKTQLEDHKKTVHDNAATREQIEALANVLNVGLSELGKDMREIRRHLMNDRRTRGKPMLQLPDRSPR